MSSGIAETTASLLDLAEFWRAGGDDLYSNVSFALQPISNDGHEGDETQGDVMRQP
ncbi:hypothetical protein MUO32_20385 [Shinella sp. CPCC 101442]|uniref:hypothetical protein n=1 Tax=Shinella sp. CPCC 101442 TaxID=2932265 RepID=UPI0021526F74|nr:hypothetical protein [Shinella sp. CPCC 101442]MCR6501397.1 hypothetical protein [Shinella sp. CPCC 101442]